MKTARHHHRETPPLIQPNSPSHNTFNQTTGEIL